MKTWKIPVSWTVTAVAEIEADTLAEAINNAKYNKDVPLPEENYYLEESWEVDDECGGEYIRNLYNNGQEDD